MQDTAVTHVSEVNSVDDLFSYWEYLKTLEANGLIQPTTVTAWFNIARERVA